MNEEKKVIFVHDMLIRILGVINFFFDVIFLLSKKSDILFLSLTFWHFTRKKSSKSSVIKTLLLGGKENFL